MSHIVSVGQQLLVSSLTVMSKSSDRCTDYW